MQLQQQEKPLKQQLRTTIWQNGKPGIETSLEKLPETLNDPQALVWLDIQGDYKPSESLLRNVFKLQHITVQTMYEEHERAKFAESDNYRYLVVHGLVFDTTTEEATTPKLDIVFAKNFIITAHQESLLWLDPLLEEARKNDPEEHLMSRGVAFLLYSILDALTDSYFPLLDTIDDLIDELEDVTVTDTSNEVQVRIFRIKRALAHMRRTISPQVEVANALVARTGKLIPAEAEPYFADIHDHLLRAFEILDSYRDLMSGLLDVYLTTVSNRLNEVMKQLTIIATIFMPITFITGVFGMNFGHLPQVEHDGGYLFWIVLLFMGIISIMQIWYFRRRKWL
ncbi:MAG TPA: magnesium/cobalt transporter CorA [Ktedonobacteraceae bacterium]